jgi:hypothetical protein
VLTVTTEEVPLNSIDRSILAGLAVIGDDAVVADPASLPSLPLGLVRVAHTHVTVPVLGRQVPIIVARIVSPLPPEGSQTRYRKEVIIVA